MYILEMMNEWKVIDVPMEGQADLRTKIDERRAF